MITYTDDYNKKTIWQTHKVGERVHIVIRKESRTVYEALDLEQAKELCNEIGNIINQIEVK